ncbi:MAG: AlwI family type II restriction endonuclease [Candidatus Omnitrophica bacterium]|nr:AlwI family type II restriction endonuclease [Candidatus Omnitrophota bacterium]
MKYSQWTIGSTTVRNPDRLRDGLQILKDSFENQKWNTSQQERFFNLLCEKGVYEAPKEGATEITSPRKQEHARKWISVLNQLGFCFAYESSEKPALITKAGTALLGNPEIEDEVFLRQLLKYQKPCVLPKQHGASFSDVSVLPFVVSLRIVHELQGLSKEEISIFLNTTVRMGDIGTIVSQIKKYRTRKNAISGNVKKREFYFATQLHHVEVIFHDEITERKVLIKELVSEVKKDIRYLVSARAKELLAGITKGGKGSNTSKAKQMQRDIVEALRAGGTESSIDRIFLGYFLPLKASTLKDYTDLTASVVRPTLLYI